MNRLASLIKQRRKAKGLTQERLAELLGVHKNNVYQWENGLHRPTSEKLIELMGILDFDVKELTAEVPAASSQ